MEQTNPINEMKAKIFIFPLVLWIANANNVSDTHNAATNQDAFPKKMWNKISPISIPVPWAKAFGIAIIVVK